MEKQRSLNIVPYVSLPNRYIKSTEQWWVKKNTYAKLPIVIIDSHKYYSITDIPIKKLALAGTNLLLWCILITSVTIGTFQMSVTRVLPPTHTTRQQQKKQQYQ